MATSEERTMNERPNRKRGANGRMRRALLGAGLVAVGVYGCSSSDEALRAAKIAGACSIDGDCAGELICAFSRCHERCVAEKDCPDGFRCVRGDVATETVCQLPDDVACEVDKDCRGDQVCAIDDECRDRCDDGEKCVLDYICANSGECASKDPTRDSVDADGNIVVEGKGGAAGTGGTSGGKAGSGSGGHTGNTQPTGGGSGEGGDGEGGEAGSGRGGTKASGGNGATSGDAGEGGSDLAAGGTSGSGGLSGSSGSGGTSAGAGGAAGTSGGGTGAAGSGGGGGTHEDLTESPDGIELVPNDTQEEAVPLTTGATIHLAGSDHDWFVVTPPQNGKSHILSLRIEQEPNLAAALTVRAAEDHSPVGSMTSILGVDSFAYITSGPNAVMHLDFSRHPISGSAGLARIVLEIVPENDVYEPNDHPDSPVLISVGQTVSGQILEPWVSAIDDHSEDWFSIALVQGTATLTFLSAPDEPRFSVRRLSATNQNESILTTEPGEIPTKQFAVPADGTYRFGFEPYAGIIVESFTSGAKPTYLTEQYSFVITQP
jgi:hypothetical protein